MERTGRHSPPDNKLHLVSDQHRTVCSVYKIIFNHTIWICFCGYVSQSASQQMESLLHNVISYQSSVRTSWTHLNYTLFSNTSPQMHGWQSYSEVKGYEFNIDTLKSSHIHPSEHHEGRLEVP